MVETLLTDITRYYNDSFLMITRRILTSAEIQYIKHIQNIMILEK